MSSFTPARDSARTARSVRFGLAAACLAASTAGFLSVGDTASAGIVPTVNLATSGNYSVLAATTVTNTGPSIIGQSVGLSPGSSITGFGPGIVLPPGTIEAANATTLQAQVDLDAAYTDAAARPVEFTQTNPDLVGQTLIPGVYEATAHGPLGLSGALVLDGQGNPNAVFIFQTNSTLITGSGSTIGLINGASECNVFWQVGSSATLGSGSVFVGNILALTSVTASTTALVHGRALARDGAVTLDTNVFVQPSCTPTPPTTTTTTTTAATPTTTAPTPTTTAATPTTTAATPATSGPTAAAPTTSISGPTPGGPAGPAAGSATTTTLDLNASDLTLPSTGGTTATPDLNSNVTLPSTGRSHTMTMLLASAALLGGIVALLAARRRPA